MGRLARAEQVAQVRIARDELRRIRELTRSIDALERELAGLVSALAPQLLAERGCGVLTAAKLIGEIAGVSRFASDAKLAKEGRETESRFGLRTEPGVCAMLEIPPACETPGKKGRRHEEDALFRRYAANPDPAQRDALVERYLRLCAAWRAATRTGPSRWKTSSRSARSACSTRSTLRPRQRDGLPKLRHAHDPRRDQAPLPRSHVERARAAQPPRTLRAGPRHQDRP